MFAAMRWDETTGALNLIDQRVLPHEETWIRAEDLETVARAIEDMAVRGAPAIGCAAAFGLAGDARAAAHGVASPWSAYRARFQAGIERLARTRPTAVNLFYALTRMKDLAAKVSDTVPLSDVAKEIERVAKEIFDHDLAMCRAIGKNGAAHLIERLALPKGRKLRALTHCNTGSLATAGYGTALGVLRALHEADKLEIVYADETRPWLQGARLTAFELKAEGIPYRLIADGAAAYLMQRGGVDFAIVGADRIAANGDTANKIGTYGVAVACKHHGIPFYVAAPFTTFDKTLPDGSGIPVEERDPKEVRHAGGKAVAPIDAPVWNPSFDVTPGTLIAGIVTEERVLTAPYRVG
jgi:methylthioribose-1-phosphate isomerase